MFRPEGPASNSHVRKGVVRISLEKPGAPKVWHRRVAVLQTSSSKKTAHDLTVVAIE
jgi:hypothetical protein